MARNFTREAIDARVAMELFDAAAELLERVRGSQATQVRAKRLINLCIEARNKELPIMDRALAKQGTSGGGV